MEVNKGDVFFIPNPQKDRLNPTGGDVIYTVSNVNGNRVSWDCTGSIAWFRNVTVGFIAEQVQDGNLIKL